MNLPEQVDSCVEQGWSFAVGRLGSGGGYAARVHRPRDVDIEAARRRGEPTRECISAYAKTYQEAIANLNTKLRCKTFPIQEAGNGE